MHRMGARACHLSYPAHPVPLCRPPSRVRWLLAAIVCVFSCGCRHSQPPATSPPPAALEPVPLALSDYAWPHPSPQFEPLANRFPLPAGFKRVVLPDRSFGQWLRFLPLAPVGTPVTVLGHRAIDAARVPHIAAVTDLDVRKAQECADTIFRLRAEYLRWANREGEISFAAGGGVKLKWAEWKRGLRPHAEGRRLVLTQTATPAASRAEFDRYLLSVFNWCGTLTLVQDGSEVPLSDVQAGDYFVHGGSPGHAVLVMDVARNDAGTVKVLLLQGFMPAQTPHIIARTPGDPWFDIVPNTNTTVPPCGAFAVNELRRFREAPPPRAPASLKGARR